MRIRTLLLGCGLIAGLCSLLLLIANHQMLQAQRELHDHQQNINAMAQDVGELTILTHEFALTHSPRVAFQWRKLANRIEGTLQSFYDTSNELPFVPLERLKVMRELFAELSAASIGASHLTTQRRELMQQQLLGNSRELGQAIGYWGQQIVLANSKAERRLLVLSLAIPISLLLLVACMAMVIWLKLLKPLGQLTQQIANVRDGHLDQRTNLPSGDEFGELSQAFDTLALDMVAQLKEEVARREAIEFSIRASEQRFRDLVNTTDGIVWEADATSFQFTFVSEQASRMLGYPLEQWLVPGFWAAHLHADDRQWVAEYCQQMTAALKPHAFEYRFMASDGRVLWLHDVVTVVTENGAPRWLRGIMVDITRRKAAEAEIIATRNHLQATLLALPDLFFEVDHTGRVLDCHAPTPEVLAYPPHAVLGKRFSELLPANSAEVCQAAIDEAASAGLSQGHQYPLQLPQGECWFEASVARLEQSELDEPRFIFIARDITANKRAHEEIKNLAFYDALTQLPNRRLLLDRLNQARLSSVRTHHHCALLLTDLDNFKSLNDTLGHDIGDLLLIEAASRFSACVREGDTVARLGGDEFVVILKDLGDADQAARLSERIASKIGKELAKPYQLEVALPDGRSGRHTHHCTLSIGITLFQGSDLSADELLKRADTAMYQAKRSGRGTLCFFDLKMQEAVSAQAALENDLRRAVIDQQFELAYQLQVDAKNHVLGAEVLLRWQHPERGWVSPAEFIPLAEESGLILPLGHWVLHTACDVLARWASDPQLESLTLAVNVSPKQFSLPTFADEVVALLEHTGAPPSRLKLELTEGLLLDSSEAVIAKMSTLKQRGISFSLDDFGTGYSSLSYLKRLPLDQLKIDQGFIRDLLVDPNDAAIARTIVALGHSLGLSVIAEGVETAQQRDFLKRMGCLAYQGYLYGKPVPLDSYEQEVRRLQAAPQERPVKGIG